MLIKTIRAAHPDKKVIIFFDEPAMVSFGSAFVSISKEEAISLFDEVIEGLDANVGIHCCGNTDWSVLLNTKVDIINYDAFNFMDTLFYFRDELSAFLERGGRIAPGIVPSSGEALDPITPADLHELWRRFKGLLLETAGTEGDESIVTTACGLGSLAEGEALKALDLLSRLPVVTAS
jgi:methionine synthase II (cobalamin-independent)